MNMRKSTVLRKLRNGGMVNCFKLNLTDGRAVEIAAMCGYDCLWLGMEHVPNDWSVIESQIWASKAHNTDTMVRISRGGYSDYIKPMELDATGIMVPHVMSLKDAEYVVRTTRFHPVGRRPVDGGNADGAYCMMDFRHYIQEANRERFVAIQIEDPEPLSELDAIAKLEGIDMLFFGPGDFSHSIGLPGETTHPEVEDARRRVAAAAVKHGKFAGTMGFNPAEWKRLAEMGYRFLNIGADVIALSEYGKRVYTSFRECLP